MSRNACAWEITECPNGLPPRKLTAHTPEEVAMLLRLPWSQGYYLVRRVQS